MQRIHVIPALSLLILAACASTPEAQENKATSSAPQASAPAATPAPVTKPVAAAPAKPVFSKLQFEKLDKALATKFASAFMNKQMAEARATVREFLSLNACLTNDDGSALQALAVTAKDFPAKGYAAPMVALPEHDKQICLTVATLGSWVAPTGTHLRFEATYEASTGKTSKIRHELRRQRDGKWAVQR
jgi:hypothetical protein